jgi:type IV secretory pathway TraG/TraD family ATPase VirD4
LENRRERGGYKPKDTDYGQYLGRAVTGSRSVRGTRTYMSFERCLICIAPPGAGKTALMLHPLLDAPGAALVASTKTDVYDHTWELRAQYGPTALFNPQNVGGLGGNFRWDPLIGCEHYQAATDRATALVRGTKAITAMQEASWGEKCIEILAKYLMAARLANQDLNSVAYWLAHPDDESAVRILRHFTPEYAPPGWAGALEAEMRSAADRMKGSIWSLARGAVAFMSNPLVSAACSKGAGESFNAREFARSRGTLYLLGDDRDETIAPLLNALTDYVYQEVKATAAASPRHRLDPPFGFFLDEVTKITPVPLDKWAADARGHGMYITAITQSFDQIRERWGEIGAGAISSLFSKVILGGIQNMRDLEELSKLIGTRKVQVVSEGESESSSGKSRSRNMTMRQEVIMPPEEIRMLPRGYALVLCGEARAVVVKYKKGQVRAERELARLRKRLGPEQSAPAQGPRVAESGQPPESPFGRDVIPLHGRDKAGAA